jgi:hypothetical protein
VPKAKKRTATESYTVIWTAQKTIEVTDETDLKKKCDQITKTLRPIFDSVSMELENEEDNDRADTSDDDDEDSEETHESEEDLDFDP